MTCLHTFGFFVSVLSQCKASHCVSVWHDLHGAGESRAEAWVEDGTGVLLSCSRPKVSAISPSSTPGWRCVNVAAAADQPSPQSRVVEALPETFSFKPILASS